MLIAVGINKAEEVLPLVTAGAGEFYVGIVPKSWSSKYGYSVSPNRRETRKPNLTSFDELAKMCDKVHAAKKEIFLTLNAHDYPISVLNDLRKILDNGIAAGIDGIIVADPSLLHSLKAWKISTKVTLSGDYGVSNMRSLENVKKLGIVNRIIFARDTLLSEMARIIERFDCFEYEAFLLNERCVFSAASCMSIHGHRPYNYCDEVISFPWTTTADQNVTYSEYRKGAIGEFWVKMRERAFTSYVRLNSNTPPALSCDLCSIPKLRKVGVKYLKIVSRGVDLDLKLLMVRTTAKIIKENTSSKAIKALFAATFNIFPETCHNGLNCYRVEK